MGKANHHDQHGHHEKHNKKHHKKRKDHRERPCPNPPSAPTGVALTFKVREKKTHLEFSAKIKWNAVTTDEQGAKIPGQGVAIDHYEIHMWPTDAAGAPIETEDGHARVRRYHKKAVRGVKIIDATTSGTVATYTSKKPHGFTAGEVVRVQDVKPNAYNGKFTVISGSGTTFTADIGASPGKLEDEGTAEGPPDPNYNYIVHHIPNPRRWYWLVKVRAWDNKDCPSDWTQIPTPLLPIQEAEPKPPPPTFVSLTFDRKGSHKHNAFRGKVKIAPVRFWDIPGGDHEDDMASYHAKIEVSEDAGLTWSKHKNLHVRDSDDEKDEDANILMIFHGARRRNRYRVTLWSVSRYHQKGDPSGPWPIATGTTIGGVPNQVKNVTITSPGPRRLVARWDEPDTPEDIDFYKVEWWKRSPLTLMETNRVRNRRDVYRVPKADKGLVHFCNVYAIDQDDNSSTAAPSADSSDTEPEAGAKMAPNAPGVPSLAYDVQGTNKSRFRALVTAGTMPVADVTHDLADHIVLQVSHAATNPGTFSPPVGAKRETHRIEADAAVDDLTEIFKGIPKNHFVWARARATNSGGRSTATAWVGGTQPSGTSTPAAVTGVTVTFPVPRRMVVDWPDPTDEEAVRYRVEIWRGGTRVENARTRNTRFVYRIPKADVDTNHSALVFAINDLNVESAASNQPLGTPSDEVFVAPGTVVPHAGGSTPTGWLRCDGAQKAVALYTDLQGIIGYTYTPAAEVTLDPTLFRVPDYRKRGPRGVGTGQTVGQNDEAAITTTDAARQDDHSGNTSTSSGNGDSNHLHGDGSLVVNSGTLIAGNTITLIPSGGNRNAAGEMHGHVANSFGGSTGAKGSDHDHGATPQGKHGRIHQHFIIKT